MASRREGSVGAALYHGGTKKSWLNIRAGLGNQVAKEIRKILLVWPRFEISFWGLQYGLPRVNRKAVHAPLPLITVAGMLPSDKYQFRHIDLNIQALSEHDVQWADLVFLSGWRAQYRSILRISLLCQRHNKKYSSEVLSRRSTIIR